MDNTKSKYLKEEYKYSEKSLINSKYNQNNQ